jgi:hypothetical protein
LPLISPAQSGINRQRNSVGDRPHASHPPAHQEHGLDPTNAANGPIDRDDDGYTNVEEYLNGLVTSRI